jgi:hypothetical protein
MVWWNEAKLSITVHTAEDPTPEEWAHYVRDIQALGPLVGQKVLVRSYGGGPDSAMRKRLIEVLGTQANKTALLTSSPVMRGIGIAVGWFNRLLRVFGLNDLEAAFAYLELTSAEQQKVLEKVAALETELGIRPGKNERQA